VETARQSGERSTKRVKKIAAGEREEGFKNAFARLLQGNTKQSKLHICPKKKKRKMLGGEKSRSWFLKSRWDKHL